MATQTKSNPVTESVETAAERVVELNEKAVLSAADSYEKAAEATKLEWLATVAATQADFTREITKAYTTAARDFVS